MKKLYTDFFFLVLCLVCGFIKNYKKFFNNNLLISLLGYVLKLKFHSRNRITFLESSMRHSVEKRCSLGKDSYIDQAFIMV